MAEIQKNISAFETQKKLVEDVKRIIAEIAELEDDTTLNIIFPINKVDVLYLRILAEKRRSTFLLIS